MDFVEKNDSCEKFYSVDYDKEKLKKILEKLKNYDYTTICEGYMAGDVTKWPATKKNIKKRVTSSFNSYITKHGLIATLLPNTIVYHNENDSNFVTYKYLTNKLPDLYDYIDLIVNSGNPFRHKRLFKNVSDAYFCFHWDQVVLEGLLNYVNSPELTNHNSMENSESSKEEYDYKGLNELYKKTLECFNFSLVAVKEYFKNPEPVNIKSMQLKKQNI